MRRGLAVCLCLLALPSPVEAATQDDLLGSYTGLGTDPFFERYPSLLFMKLNVTQRLQTSSQIDGTELAQHTALLLILRELEQLDVSITDPDFRSLTTGLDQLAFLREHHETADDPHIADNRALLLRAEDTMVDLYLIEAESFAAQTTRTQERLELLAGAMAAAESIQDAPSFARLSQTHTRLHTRYQADIMEAASRRDRVSFLLANPVPVLDVGFPAFYSDLLTSVEALPGAADRYEAHGESENTFAVDSLQAQGEDYARRYGIVAGVVLAVWCLVWVGVLALGLGRIRRWAHDNRHAGLGDELGADV